MTVPRNRLAGLARSEHDAHLDLQAAIASWHTDSGFARVLHGNAVERHRRPRRRPLRVLRRWAGSLVRWLLAPSPWEPRP
jgi:hypothetical protein